MIEGHVNIDELKNDISEPRLLIIDDMIAEMTGPSKKGDLNTLFTKGAHHWNVSVILIVQNLFHSGLRNSRLNAHYVFLFKSPDKMQINNFGRQLYPGKAKILTEAYADAVNGGKKFNPLLVDLTCEIDERFRLRANILPDDERATIYVPTRL
jgi:hypothetical protein